MREKIFLKAILISFFIHIFGISLFSIFLPLPLKRRKPLEVSLYPFQSKKISQNINISKKIKENIGNQKVPFIENIPPIKISTKDIIGEKGYVSKVNFKLNIEEVKFEPSLPVVNFSEIQQEFREELIEGPAGKRKIIYKEKIEYPLWAQKKGMEGKVKIKFWVSPEGKIYNTEIFSSSGYPEIDLYAEENFKKWVFEKVESEKNVWGIITITFKLRVPDSAKNDKNTY